MSDECDIELCLLNVCSKRLIVSLITRKRVDTTKSLKPLVLVLTLLSCQSSLDRGFSLFGLKRESQQEGLKQNLGCWYAPAVDARERVVGSLPAVDGYGHGGAEFYTVRVKVKRCVVRVDQNGVKGHGRWRALGSAATGTAVYT